MHATSAYNFNRKLLEEEWNFDGFNVSDAADPYKDFYTMDMAIRSGLTMLLCDWGTLSTYEQGTGTYEGVTLFVTGEWDDNAQCVKVKNYSADATGATTVASYTNWYHLRMVVMRSLFTEVNSIIGNNGINLSHVFRKLRRTPRRTVDFRRSDYRHSYRLRRLQLHRDAYVR